MAERYYVSEPLCSGDLVLDESETHHFAHVRRGKVGDSIELFDGFGGTATAEVTKLKRRHVTVQVSEVVKHEKPDGPELILATAVPKGDRFRWLIEKATELGVSRLIPLLTERSVVDPRQHKLDKLRQTVIAACKQCGRDYLMEIDEPTSWDAFLENTEGNASARYLLHPGGDTQIQQSGSTTTQLIFAIGPEGGFTDEEVNIAKDREFQILSAGNTILRTETAAIYAAALAQVATSIR
ncbi:16S rRNA (uracil(1498)-N(3))-methyltransferase [Calycomorphotria hydatis]|uniref:Ribosomal RNA small subunit methyltransferase E n=1 Tax=Calycomorphotria hydatis TaxID=2528027 RepID=A0A517TC10_9PLAN|nr:16S rRNA (uracil(1498)-N(3))-methyltransferase [Calycomorphotria hydatis]QDT65899.1 Ribosomal RNA small subunit methyltransferase E [Calycomorphotria hydatis]